MFGSVHTRTATAWVRCVEMDFGELDDGGQLASIFILFTCFRHAQFISNHWGKARQQLQTLSVWPLLLLPWELFKCMKKNPHPPSTNTGRHSKEEKKRSKDQRRSLKFENPVLHLGKSSVSNKLKLGVFFKPQSDKIICYRFLAYFPHSPCRLSRATKITIAVWFPVCQDEDVWWHKAVKKKVKNKAQLRILAD